MKVNKVFLFFPMFLLLIAHAEENTPPKFSSYPVNIEHSTFVEKVNFSDRQKMYSEKWKKLMRNSILKPVNFSGHYVIYISKLGELPEECGNDGWVCGWIIDKINGKVISELPAFNGNTKYYSIIDNGTPSPDLFDAEFYATSSMLWIRGQNIPANGKAGEDKCANVAYDFKSDLFIKLFSGNCEIDAGSASNADHILP